MAPGHDLGVGVSGDNDAHRGFKNMDELPWAWLYLLSQLSLAKLGSLLRRSRTKRRRRARVGEAVSHCPRASARRYLPTTSVTLASSSWLPTGRFSSTPGAEFTTATISHTPADFSLR